MKKGKEREKEIKKKEEKGRTKKELREAIWKTIQHKTCVKNILRQLNLCVLLDEEELISNCCEGHKYLATGAVKTKNLKFCNPGYKQNISPFSVNNIVIWT